MATFTFLAGLYLFHSAALFVLDARTARTRLVRLAFGSFRRSDIVFLITFDQRREGLVLVKLESVVLGLGADHLLAEPVSHLAALPCIVAILADVVIGAVFALVAVAYDWAHAAAVARDATVLAKVGRLLIRLLFLRELERRELGLDLLPLRRLGYMDMVNLGTAGELKR